MDKRIIKTRAAIQSAYFELLSEKKNAKISITDIAKKANIDRKTFYLHYTTTDEIIRDFCKEKVDTLMERLKKEEEMNHPFSIKLLFENLTHLISENLELFEILSTGSNADCFFDEIRQLLISIIATDYNHYFKFNETELRIYAEFYMSGIISTYNLWIKNQIPIPVNDLASLVSDAAIKGLDALISEK